MNGIHFCRYAIQYLSIWMASQRRRIRCRANWCLCCVVVSLTWFLKHSEVISAKQRRCRIIRARLLDLTTCMISAWGWRQCTASIFPLLDAFRSVSWRFFLRRASDHQSTMQGAKENVDFLNWIWNICVLTAMLFLRAGGLFTAIDPQFFFAGHKGNAHSAHCNSG